MGGECANFCCVGFLGCWPIEEHAFQQRHIRHGGIVHRQRYQFLRRALIPLAAALFQPGAQLGQQCQVTPLKHLFYQGLFRDGGGKGETLQQPGPWEGMLRECPTVVHHLEDHVTQAVCPAELGRQPIQQGRLRAFGHGLNDLMNQPVHVVVVHFHKLGAHPGLQGETAQQTGAEGVDGLDLQAARGFNGAGKQGAGVAQPLRGKLRLPQCIQFLAQAGIRQHGPFPQGMKQSVLHLCRRRLGVGDAENLLGAGATEQQPRHPVGEHPCFTGTGIGGQPGGAVRSGRLDLTFSGGIPIHAISWGWAVVALSHSPKRARWS